MYELLMELGFCGNYSSRTFSVQDSGDVHDPTQRWSRTIDGRLFRGKDS